MYVTVIIVTLFFFKEFYTWLQIMQTLSLELCIVDTDVVIVGLQMQTMSHV